MAYVDKINKKKIMRAIFDSFQAALEEAGDEIVQEAVKRVPWDTGNLSKSLDKSPVHYDKSKNQLEIRVGSWGVPYAAAQEFGTAIRGEPLGSPPLKGWPHTPPGKKTWDFYTIVPRNKPYLRFKIGNKWVSTKEVIHPGVPAQPYMRPAFDSVMRTTQWKRIVHKNVKRGFIKAGFKTE